MSVSNKYLLSTYCVLGLRVGWVLGIQHGKKLTRSLLSQSLWSGLPLQACFPEYKGAEEPRGFHTEVSETQVKIPVTYFAPCYIFHFPITFRLKKEVR